MRPSLLLVLLLAGCQPEPIKDLENRNFPGVAYRIEFPIGWEHQGKEHQFHRVAISPKDDEEDEFQENIGVVLEALPRVMSAEDYLARCLERAGNELENHSVVSQGTTDLDGYQVILVEQTWRVEQDEAKGRGDRRRPGMREGKGAGKRTPKETPAKAEPEKVEEKDFLELRGLAWILVRDKAVYVISATATADDFARYRGTFEDCAASFALVEE